MTQHNLNRTAKLVVIHLALSPFGGLNVLLEIIIIKKFVIGFKYFKQKSAHVYHATFITSVDDFVVD